MGCSLICLSKFSGLQALEKNIIKSQYSCVGGRSFQKWFHVFRTVFKGLSSKDVKQQVQLLRAEHSPCRWDVVLLTSSQAQAGAHRGTLWVRGLEAGEQNPGTNSVKD